MNIPIFRLNFDNEFQEKFHKGCKEIFASDGLSEGKYVKLFEKNFAIYSGANYAIATNSGTSALEIILRSLNVKNKNVIIPTNTFFATATAVEQSGGIIELVDCDSETFAIDVDSLQKKINDGTGAVIVVHIGGIIPSNISDIKNICDQNGVPLVEDAAHAHGSKMDNHQAGSIGVAGAFSFYPTKVMTTGEGGMITTNDSTLAKKIKSLKNFGRAEDDEGVCFYPNGVNGKISEFTGLLGYLELKRVKSRVEKRNDLVRQYKKRLLDNDSYKFVLQKKGLCSHYKLILKIKTNRSSLRRYLKKKNIALTGEVYRLPIHLQHRYLNEFSDNFPIAEDICNNHICPPLYPELEMKEVDYICDNLIKASNTLK